MPEESELLRRLIESATKPLIESAILPPVPTLSIGELLKKEFPPGKFIIGSGLMNRGSLLVIGGGPKSYKSVIACSMMCHLATAQPLFGISRTIRGGEVQSVFPIDEGHKILYFEQEIGEEDLQDRFQKYLGGLSKSDQILCAQNINIHSSDWSLRLDTTEGVRKIREVIGDVKPNICFFDPLIEFHSLDENSSEAMMKILHPLDYLRAEFQFTAGLVHHSSKPSENGRHGAQLLRGSSVLHGKGDSFMMVETDKKEEDRVKIVFDIRRGKKPKPLWLKINPENFHVNFDCWDNDPRKKK